LLFVSRLTKKALKEEDGRKEEEKRAFARLTKKKGKE
jgi:hypothetical protein